MSVDKVIQSGILVVGAGSLATGSPQSKGALQNRRH